MEDEVVTITFCETAENHVGMEKIGKVGKYTGFTTEELEHVAKDLVEAGYEAKVYDLVKESGLDLDLEDASLLVIKKGVSYFTQKNVMEELQSLDWDSKMYNSRRNIVQNKLARHNLCFADYSSDPDYSIGKGRVYNFEEIPSLKEIRGRLDEVFGYKAFELVAEGNRYYDVKKCGIGFHGDSERSLVTGFRFGPKGGSFPLIYQWYHRFSPVGKRIEIDLEDGDVYAMSEKAVGKDWKESSKYTLRHAAGFHKRFVGEK